jgi:hypothetical protein
MNVVKIHTSHRPPPPTFHGFTWSVHVQGGAVNCELFFAGPLPSLLGAVSRKISENQMGGGPDDGVNLAGTSWLALTVEMACRRITTQSFARKE